MSTEAAIRLIYEEVCLRRDAGQEVGTAEVVRRFPQWKEELEVLLGCDRMLRPLAASSHVPGGRRPPRSVPPACRARPRRLGKDLPGDRAALADRLVVLKVISDDQEEHLRLARLQHTHIVPLYSEQTFPDRGLRALCMPYLGGASLAQDPATRWATSRSTAAAAAISSRASNGSRSSGSGAGAARFPTGRAVVTSRERPTSRPSAGSGRAWPKRSSMPTRAACSTWTSRRRMS